MQLVSRSNARRNVAIGRVPERRAQRRELSTLWIAHLSHCEQLLVCGRWRIYIPTQAIRQRQAWQDLPGVLRKRSPVVEIKCSGRAQRTEYEERICGYH